MRHPVSSEPSVIVTHFGKKLNVFGSSPAFSLFWGVSACPRSLSALCLHQLPRGGSHFLQVSRTSDCSQTENRTLQSEVAKVRIYTCEAELTASGCPTFSHSSEVALNHTLPTQRRADNSVAPSKMWLENTCLQSCMWTWSHMCRENLSEINTGCKKNKVITFHSGCFKVVLDDQFLLEISGN